MDRICLQADLPLKISHTLQMMKLLVYLLCSKKMTSGTLRVRLCMGTCKGGCRPRNDDTRGEGMFATNGIENAQHFSSWETWSFWWCDRKPTSVQRKFSQVIFTAKFLVAEIKGMLVSIEKLKKGHAIIIYCGKNYRRPKWLLSNLLDKREALSRSLEMQRIGSPKYFAKQREQTITSLKSKLGSEHTLLSVS